MRERRRTVADDLYERITNDRQSFWTTVYPLFMQREITRSSVRDVVRRGLQDARGNYKIVARMFNMEGEDYKRFLNFLRKHDCHVPYKPFRTISGGAVPVTTSAHSTMWSVNSLSATRLSRGGARPPVASGS